VGRLLSLIEGGAEAGRTVGRLSFHSGSDPEQVVGVTGAPGAGKSTLTDHLISRVRAGGTRVGVLAIDPSSPFSGGAILGDRIRMQRHVLDEGVFIRSMATRGHLGGLALAASEAIRLLVAVGMPIVVVETVGVGQVEVDVAGAADTTIVVVNPGWGDAVQASKAGLLEIADLFVINKADRPGAEETRRDLEIMLDMNPSMGQWRPPVVMTTAMTGAGADEVWDGVTRHRGYLRTSGELQIRRDLRLADELAKVLVSRVEADLRRVKEGPVYAQVERDVLAHRVDPYEAVDRLLAQSPPPTGPGPGV
jgi:LAO/AO transport system kinase